MIKYIVTILLISYYYLLASSPVLPKGYRALIEDELSLSLRDSDKNKYALVVADFNGDDLIDGATMAVDSTEKELAIFVFIYNKDTSDYTWYKIQSLPYIAYKYTGIKKVSPGKVKYYRKADDEKKDEIRLENDSLKLFNFEGSSSLFYYQNKSKTFERIWISK